MPSLADFLALNSLGQAFLVLVASIMSWRGLRLSGDRGWRHWAWGGLCVVCFAGSLLLGAKANHDASVEISQANTNEAAASGKLSQIQETMQSMSSALGKIAGAANVNPNQSTDELAKNIIKKLAAMQDEIDQTGARVSTLENPPPDPNKIYQDGRPVGDVIKGHYTDPDRKGIVFDEIDNSGAVDFSKPLEFRGFELTCQPTIMSFMFGTSPTTGQPTQAVRQNVSCQRTS